MTDDEIRIKLLALVKSVKEIVETERASGAIQPEYEIFTSWKVTEFKYDDLGVHVAKSGSQITEPSWHFAFVKIIKIAENFDAYISLSNFLQSIPEINERGSSYASHFLNRLISLLLTKEKITDKELEGFTNRFISEIKGQPMRSGTIAQLVGIILQRDEIEISHGIILRKPKKEDFEIDIPIYSISPLTHFSDPTAFLEISFLAKNPREVSEELTKTITILRLYKPGSVKWLTHRIYSDSITRFLGGTAGSGDTFPALENYHINDEDVNNLKKFYERISPILPPIFYRWDVGQENHITIAYNRYSDALLQSGIIERRIANAIMGLEALYFKPSGEQQELIYRLSIRIAKVLGILSLDPIQVKRAIKDAYAMRSSYAHGGHFSAKEKDKIAVRYNGDIKNLLHQVLDYLRISIIMSMTIHQKKENFIEIIDNALIDENANKHLISVLNPTKDILKKC